MTAAENQPGHGPTSDVELEIADLAYGGDGVGRHDGRAIFVAGALPGELVRVRIARERGKYAHARLLEVLRPSPDRVAPRYPELGESGAIAWQHLAYPAQVTWKTRITRQLLLRVGHFASPTVHPMLAMPDASDTWRYRTVAQFAVGAEGAIGFRRAASHDVIELTECPIVAPALDALYQQVRGWLRARWGATAARYVERFSLRVPATPLDDGTPRLLPPTIPPLPRAGAAAREPAPPGAAVATDALGLLTLEAPPGGALEPDTAHAIAVELLRMAPSLVGVVIVGLPGGRVVAGQDHTFDQVFDRVYRVSAGSFFQVNAAQTPVLVERVLAAAHCRPSDQVLDGYSGVGLFSLFLAGRAAHVRAVESAASAVADARASAVRNGIANVLVIEGVLERALTALTQRHERVDVALVDPPRAGCDPRALEAIRALRPRTFVYVSCDPSTLARDLRLLCAEDYQLVDVQPVDLFPHTPHIECVAVCERTEMARGPGAPPSGQRRERPPARPRQNGPAR
ncbi:MAG TPA: 23S rRNA (uracil(1939)-C(5))-methyltransferase RlmD [Ktedonobacterales bacterium]